MISVFVIIVNYMSFLQYLINYDSNFSFNFNDIMFVIHVRIKHVIGLMFIMFISYLVSIQFYILSCLYPILAIKQTLNHILLKSHV